MFSRTTESPCGGLFTLELEEDIPFQVGCLMEEHVFGATRDHLSWYMKKATVKILYDTTEALKSPLPSKSKLSHRGPPPSGAVATTKTRREGRDGYHHTFVHTHKSEHKPGALGDYDVSVQVHWVEQTSHSGEGCYSWGSLYMCRGRGLGDISVLASQSCYQTKTALKK